MHDQRVVNVKPDGSDSKFQKLTGHVNTPQI